MGAILVEIVATLLAALFAVLPLILLGENGALPKVAAAAGLLLMIFAGQIARRAYFRCPVCAAALPRGPRQVKASEFFNGCCAQCGTRFIRPGA